MADPGTGERRRLEHQFALLREDFDQWFDAALRLGGLATDPARARWSALDAGCGEGLFTHEIAERYPHASVLGFDLDERAVTVAGRRCAGQPRVRVTAHDARQPLDAGPFDVAVMWLVLPYLPDRRTVLAHLAAAVRPGGVLLLGTVPDEAMRIDHPAGAGLMAAGRKLAEQLGLGGLQDSLTPLLTEAGFAEIATRELRYPVGGATRAGQRWYDYVLTGMSVARPLVVDRFALLSGAEYDHDLDRLRAADVLDLDGDVRFLVTIARRN